MNNHIMQRQDRLPQLNASFIPNVLTIYTTPPEVVTPSK